MKQTHYTRSLIEVGTLNKREARRRYWVKFGSLPWQEVTAEQFIEMEHIAGFYPKPGCGPFATGGFYGNDIKGRITPMEIGEEVLDCDSEFMRDAKKEES